MENTMLIIDGSALLTTTYYGNLPDEVKMCHGNVEEEQQYYQYIQQTSDGIYTNAISGFLTRLDMLIAEHSPSHLAITFDVSRKSTFRAQMYPEYKGQRKAMPAPLAMQKELLPMILRDMGIPVLSHPTYEGDDLVGSLAKQFENDVNVVIYANDRDMTQLVDSNIRMWYTTTYERAKDMYERYTGGMAKRSYDELPIPMGCFVFTPKTVEWNFGIIPSQVPDWKGLGGDASDNIPGVRGISEEASAKIIHQFGSIEALYEWIESTPEKEAEQIWTQTYELGKRYLTALKKEGAKENALFSKKLATIVTDIPIVMSLYQFETQIRQDAELQCKKDLQICEFAPSTLIEEMDR